MCVAGPAHSSLSSSPAYLHMLPVKSPRLGTLPKCKRLWTQSGSSSMTGMIIFMSILSVHSENTSPLVMSSTVQPWRGKTSMFTQVLSQQPRHGSAPPPHSQVQREWELRVHHSLLKAICQLRRQVRTNTEQFLPLSFASGVHPSKLDGAINLGDIFHFNTRLLSSVFLLLL